MSSLMFYCLKVLISAIFEKPVTQGPTDQRTDGRTDGRTEKASYRDAWTHLKMGYNFSLNSSFQGLAILHDSAFDARFPISGHQNARS